MITYDHLGLDGEEKKGPGGGRDEWNEDYDFMIWGIGIG
jgi:hypothetical protein